MENSALFSFHDISNSHFLANVLFQMREFVLFKAKWSTPGAIIHVKIAWQA